DRLNEYAVSSIVISCQQGVVHHIQHCPHTAFSYWVAFCEALAPTDAQGTLRLLRHFWRISLPGAMPEVFDSFSTEFTEVLSAHKAADVDLAMVYSSHLLATLPPALDSLQVTISVSNPVALPSTDALLELIRNEILRASLSFSPATALLANRAPSSSSRPRGPCTTSTVRHPALALDATRPATGHSRAPSSPAIRARVVLTATLPLPFLRSPATSPNSRRTPSR
ncbi:hypothetical protein JCM1840_000190, partial [Sporobolomyces johnsonii]